MESAHLKTFLPMRMLIVEDDAFMAELIADHYRDIGFDIELSVDGKAALSRMEECLPDIVLCDRRMPVMSGADLLEIVRSKGPEWQQVIFIFVTGLSDHRDRFSMLKLNPDGYICKPLDFVVADQAIVTAIVRRQVPAGAGQG